MAKPKGPTRHEALGAAVVTTVLQCNADFIDNGSPGHAGAIVDYVLELRDGERAGLEISTITDRKLRELSASAMKQQDWTLVKSRYLWYLGVEGKAAIKELRAECDDLLSVLEEYDELVFSDTVLPRLEGEAKRAAQRLLDLGVITATANGDSDGRAVRVHPSWHSKAFHPGQVINGRVSLEAQNNKDKFLVHGRTQGHLFLWVEDLVSSIAGSLLGGFERRYIGAPPDLPAGVTVVWLVPDPFTTEVADRPVWPFSSESGDGAITVVRHVWRVEPPGQWEYLGDVRIRSICTPEHRLIYPRCTS